MIILAVISHPRVIGPRVARTADYILLDAVDIGRALPGMPPAAIPRDAQAFGTRRRRRVFFDWQIYFAFSRPEL